MSEFKPYLDISGLTQFLENFTKEVTRDIQKGVEGLAEAAHGHILEEAKKKLNKYDRPIYEQNLSQAKQIDGFLWEITLIDEGANIENGREERDMKPGLLNTVKNGAKPAKTTKDGRKYRIIPMPQGKESTSENPKDLAKSEELIGNIKSFLKAQNPRLSYKGIEKHTIVDPVTGSPKKVPKLSPIGADGHPKPLHVFDIPSRIPGKGNTEQLARLHIYQVTNKNGNAKKVMTTFRTVLSEGQEDKWMYPARPAVNIFQETEEWAKNEWDRTWLPQIMEKYR